MNSNVTTPVPCEDSEAQRCCQRVRICDTIKQKHQIPPCVYCTFGTDIPVEKQVAALMEQIPAEAGDAGKKEDSGVYETTRVEETVKNAKPEAGEKKKRFM